MTSTVPLYDLSPVLWVLLTGALIALLPLGWVLWRNRRLGPQATLRALTLMTLFLTFDLILFGAFTRLTDSGLGCPDWPGCYGNASPVGAHAEISQAQAALPDGPVTHSKAWIEMVHRYLATSVGGLCVVLAIMAWWQAWRGVRSISPWLPTFTLFWVSVQGAFGALTVTMKLFPAIVSLHLLGAYFMLGLLVWQAVLLHRAPASGGSDASDALTHNGVSTPLRWAIGAALALLVVQAASGAWVSTNYAVLACTEFPQCQGRWWPAMDFAQGFTLWRPLGESGSGQIISFQAITAIHIAHRMLAMLTALVLLALAWRLRRVAALHKPARYLAALVVLQLLTGLSNVVLGWPLLAALFHTGGAGAMLAVLVWMLALTAPATQPQPRSTHAH